MERHPDERLIRDDCPVTERQVAYSLDRLSVAVKEMSRLIETRPSNAIERVLACLDNAVDYTSIGIEDVHQLRLWRANAHWLVTELDAATRSFHQAEQQLGRRIGAALASWGQRFEVSSPGPAGRSTATIGRQSRLRGLLRRGPAVAPLDGVQEGRLCAAGRRTGGCLSGAAGIDRRASTST